VYGSVAKGTDKAGSYIDLMVVSDRLDHATLFEILQPAESVLARRVNPTVMSRKEWRTVRLRAFWLPGSRPSAPRPDRI
jgi:predicted nucleotidyltransferase